MRDISKDSKIAVAMSGGVDSSVAAALLVAEGYGVTGIFMEHLDGMEGQKNSAKATADKLGIPLEVVDYREEFKNTVIDYFLDEYRDGRTPNPCVVCNKWIKFGKLLEYTKRLGCNYLATGHYSRLRRKAPNTIRQPADQISNKREEREYEELFYKLLMAEDKSKDQSYFLWRLEQKQLEHILFPIGDLIKSRVVKLADRKSLPAVKRPESFEVCFVRASLEEFLRKNIPEAIEPGPVLNTRGEIIGKHEGLPLYTYGQRRGFDVTEYQGIPQYVVGMDKGKNALIVGRGEASEVESFGVEDTNWLAPNSKFNPPVGGPNDKLRKDGGRSGRTSAFPNRSDRSGRVFPAEVKELAGSRDFRCKVRVRHLGELMDCVVQLLENKEAKVILDESSRAIAPGQSAVFYAGEEVLGGGVISHLGG